MLQVLVVAIGGAVGAALRYLVSLWAAGRFGTHFPFGTLLVNVAGCFIIGFFMTLATERIILHPYWRLFFTVGILGGLTTFSSFSYETVKLISDAGYQIAILNLGMNMILCLLATITGISLAKL